MKKTNNKDKFVGFRADVKLVERIDAAAASLGLGTSAFLRRIYAYIDDRGDSSCGRWSAFRDYSKRIDKLTLEIGL